MGCRNVRLWLRHFWARLSRENYMNITLFIMLISVTFIGLFLSSFTLHSFFKREIVYNQLNLSGEEILYTLFILIRLKHGLSVCNLFKYSLFSLNVEMHTYCYRRTHKTCRAGLKGILHSAAFPPLKTEGTFRCKCASVCKQTHNRLTLPCRCFGV